MSGLLGWLEASFETACEEGGKAAIAVGLGAARLTPVGWAVTATGIFHTIHGKVGESHLKDTIKENDDYGLQMVPGGTADACLYVTKRGGMVFNKPGKGWYWHPSPSFRPKSYSATMRATKRLSDGTWKFR